MVESLETGLRAGPLGHPHGLPVPGAGRLARYPVPGSLYGAADLLAGEGTVHAAGCLAPVGDGVDDFLAAVHGVPAAVDTGEGGLAAGGIDDHPAGPIELEAGKDGRQPLLLLFLAKGLDDHVAGEFEVGVRQGLDPTALGGTGPPAAEGTDAALP